MNSKILYFLFLQKDTLSPTRRDRSLMNWFSIVQIVSIRLSAIGSTTQVKQTRFLYKSTRKSYLFPPDLSCLFRRNQKIAKIVLEAASSAFRNVRCHLESVPAVHQIVQTANHEAFQISHPVQPIQYNVSQMFELYLTISMSNNPFQGANISFTGFQISFSGKDRREQSVRGNSFSR